MVPCARSNEKLRTEHAKMAKNAIRMGGQSIFGFWEVLPSSRAFGVRISESFPIRLKSYHIGQFIWGKVRDVHEACIPHHQLHQFILIPSLVIPPAFREKNDVKFLPRLPDQEGTNSPTLANPRLLLSFGCWNRSCNNTGEFTLLEQDTPCAL